MYRELQTLDPQPFQDTIDTVFFFSGGGRREIIDDIKAALSQSVSLLLLTGGEGAGKTMVCRMVEKELPAQMISVFLPQAINSFDDMVRTVMQETGFGPEEEETDTAILLEKIVAVLQERDLSLVVFFDEAEKIYLATLERVRKLLDQVNEEKTIFQFVFSGRHLLEDNLKQLSIVTFKDVEERRFTLRPLNEEESCSYLNHCMKIASGEDEPFFPHDLVKKVSSGGTNFKRLNHFALEAFQSDQLDTTFLRLLDTIEDQPASIPAGERRERESSAPARRREVNLEFLSFRKILPGWILYGGGVSIAALLIFFWLDFTGDREPPKDTTLEVPIIELKRVVPLNAPPAQEIAAETEETAELQGEQAGEDKSREANPAAEPAVSSAEKPAEPVIIQPKEKAAEKPAEQPVEPVIVQPEERAAEKPAEQPAKAVIAQPEERAAEKPAEQPAEAVIAQPEEKAAEKLAEQTSEPEISVVEVEAAPLPDLIEKKPTPVPNRELEPEIPAVAEKSAVEVPDAGAEGTNNVLVEPLEETERPFSADTIKQTRLPEPIVIIGDEKKFKDSTQEVANGVTIALPTEDTIPALTDKAVDALFLRRIAAGARWLVGGGSGKYTIQLMVLTSDKAEESLKKMLRTAEYQNVSDQLYVLRRTGPDPTVMVFYGEYPNLAAARNSRNNLPVFLRKHSPYAISVFGAVEKATAPQ